MLWTAPDTTSIICMRRSHNRYVRLLIALCGVNKIDLTSNKEGEERKVSARFLFCQCCLLRASIHRRKCSAVLWCRAAAAASSTRRSICVSQAGESVRCCCCCLNALLRKRKGWQTSSEQVGIGAHRGKTKEDATRGRQGRRVFVLLQYTSYICLCLCSRRDGAMACTYIPNCLAPLAPVLHRPDQHGTAQSNPLWFNQALLLVVFNGST